MTVHTDPQLERRLRWQLAKPATQVVSVSGWFHVCQRFHKSQMGFIKELEALSPKMHFPKRMCSLIYKYYIFLVSQKVLICTVLTRTLGQIADLGTSGQTFGDSRKSTEPGR